LKKLILLRHASHAELGRALSGRSEIALDERGRAQARVLCWSLAAMPLASLHSSPRRRALETIAPLANTRSLPVHSAPALDEIAFGRFTGKSFHSLDADLDWHVWNAQRGTARCPGGETMAEAAARAVDYVESLDSAAFPALMVTHCDIIRAIVGITLRTGFDRLFDLACDPASWTVLDVSGSAWRLLAQNQTAGKASMRCDTGPS